MKIKQQSKRLDRVHDILKRISKTPLTMSELAKIYGVSTKTIQRDFNEYLSHYGAVKKGRKLSIRDVDTNIDSDDKIVINILDNMAKSLGFEFYNKAHVLLKGITYQLNQPIITHISSEELDEKSLENFTTLESAISEKRVVECRYKNHKFRVLPLKLAMFEGFWYLLLFDTNDSDKFKKFYLSGISDINPLDESFEISQETESRLGRINSAWATLDKPKTATLLLDKQIVKYFKRKEYAKQTLRREAGDGSVEIDIEYTDLMEIKPLVYYFLPFIKVIEPKELADVIKNEMQGYLDEIC
ncbi:MAG: WYL domain-containing transcriptional regulator [Campylobacteraceae bacterium]|nr:WYL domain-containing transcriptional regulator [Campylobacteraceae bacterium]